MKKAFYDNNLFTCPQTNFLHHTRLHLPHFTHPSPTHTKTSLRNSLPQNGVPRSVQSNEHITYLSRISCIPNYLNLSLSRLTLRVQTISFTAHTNICTCTLARIFMFFSKRANIDIQVNTNLYFTIYAFYTEWPLEYQERSHHHIKKTTLTLLT